MLLGIMVSPISKLHSACYARIARAGRHFGVDTFFFSPEAIRSAYGSISGYSYNVRTNRWRKSIEYRAPDVVYNQVMSRIFEHKRSYSNACHILRKHGSIIFNPHFLSKATVARCLQKSKDLAPYLPETYLIKKGQSGLIAKIFELLGRYDSVYVKPINGSLGIGIIKIAKLGERHFLVTYQGEMGKRTYRVKECSNLAKKIRAVTRDCSYIIQQGLKLVGPKGGPVDFRVLVQKDGTGRWRHTYTFAKVSRKGAIVSNVAAGASVREANAVLSRITMSSSNILDLMVDIAIEAAQTIDEYVSPLGELGIDIGVDISGHPWVLEANAKYSKKVFPKKIAALGTARIVAYSMYLTQTKCNGKP